MVHCLLSALTNGRRIIKIVKEIGCVLLSYLYIVILLASQVYDGYQSYFSRPDVILKDVSER